MWERTDEEHSAVIKDILKYLESNSIYSNRKTVAAAQLETPLLDESTVKQDYAGLEELMRILNLLPERNVSTVITVTHDTRCALSLCDRAVCLASDVIADEGNKCLL